MAWKRLQDDDTDEEIDHTKMARQNKPFKACCKRKGTRHDVNTYNSAI